MSKDLREALEEAQKVIAEQQAFIDSVKNAALTITNVVYIGKGFAVVGGGSGKMSKVNVPKGMPLEVGDSVLVHPGSGQIIEHSKVPSIGKLVTLQRIIDKDRVEVELQGTQVTILAGKLGKNAAVGDRLILDASDSAVVVNLGKIVDAKIHTEATNITFDHIAGLQDAKRELNDALVLPYKHPEIYAHYKKRPPKGILLYGPPGCGKTMLAKAAATTLAEVCAAKGVSHEGFIYIKGPEILDRFVGVAEAAIRAIFTQAREYKEKAGHPALIFIDEADAILGVRGASISSDMEKTIVPAFLAEMDGLNESGAIVLLATNRADSLDPAVTRDGRIDRKIRIPRPDIPAAVSIFELNLALIPLGEAITTKQIALNATKELYSPQRILLKVKTRDGKLHPMPMKEIVNGGMIASIVDQASSAAMHRDLKSGKSGGLLMQDLYDAIDLAQKQNARLNNNEAIADFLNTAAGGADFDSISF